jgi:hypothetical protein
MYLVILAMVPLVMALHRSAGHQAVIVALILLWLVANSAGYARRFGDAEDLTMIQQWVADFGGNFLWMNLPGIPWEPNATWFFNPFAWQLIFFTGFAFGMGWLPAPPVRRWLIWLAVAVVILSLPVAWHKMYQYLTGYIPQEWGGGFLWDLREALAPFYWKTWQGVFRYTHFLALAYLAWVAVGAGGIRLNEGWRTPGSARKPIFWTAAVVAAVTIPYAYVQEIALLPPLNDLVFALYRDLPQAVFGVSFFIPANQIGLAQIAHLIALIIVVWSLLSQRSRDWVVKDAWLKVVPVVRKVGTQSLAVFMVSIPLSRFDGFLLDVIGRDVWTLLLVHSFGFSVLIATAYLASTFKKQPWRVK